MESNGQNQNAVRRGIPIVISGPSGSGKGTVVSALLAAHADFELSVSVTTRKPRAGEIDGTHYFFTSEERFAEMERGGELLEHAGYVGHYYGTPAARVEQSIAAGRNVILEIDVQGGLQIRARRPDTVLIFLIPPDSETLERRLRDRRTDDERTIAARLARAEEECVAAQACYDYVVVNEDGDIGGAAEQIAAIVSAEQCRLARRDRFLKEYFQNMNIKKEKENHD